MNGVACCSFSGWFCDATICTTAMPPGPGTATISPSFSLCRRAANSIGSCSAPRTVVFVVARMFLAFAYSTTSCMVFIGGSACFRPSSSEASFSCIATSWRRYTRRSAKSSGCSP